MAAVVEGEKKNPNWPLQLLDGILLIVFLMGNIQAWQLDNKNSKQVGVMKVA